MPARDRRQVNVRALPTVAEKAIGRGVLRHGSERRRVGPALQHRPRQFGGQTRQLRHKLRHKTAFSETRPRCKLRERLVGERGFEPPTPWSRTRCSTRLSHSPTKLRAVTGKAILPHALLLFTSRWAPRL